MQSTEAQFADGGSGVRQKATLVRRVDPGTGHDSCAVHRTEIVLVNVSHLVEREADGVDVVVVRVGRRDGDLLLGGARTDRGAAVWGRLRYRNYTFWGMTFMFREVARGSKG